MEWRTKPEIYFLNKKYFVSPQIKICGDFYCLCAICAISLCAHIDKIRHIFAGDLFCVITIMFKYEPVESVPVVPDGK